MPRVARYVPKSQRQWEQLVVLFCFAETCVASRIMQGCPVHLIYSGLTPACFCSPVSHPVDATLKSAISGIISTLMQLKLCDVTVLSVYSMLRCAVLYRKINRVFNTLLTFSDKNMDPWGRWCLVTQSRNASEDSITCSFLPFVWLHIPPAMGQTFLVRTYLYLKLLKSTHN